MGANAVGEQVLSCHSRDTCTRPQLTRNMKASTATRAPWLVTMNESKSMRVRAERQLDSMMPGRTSSLREASKGHTPP